MESNWPADAARIELARAIMRETGKGAFVLITRSFVLERGEVVPYAMTHRFETEAQREQFAEWAKTAGLQVEVVL